MKKQKTFLSAVITILVLSLVAFGMMSCGEDPKEELGDIKLLSAVANGAPFIQDSSSLTLTFDQTLEAALTSSHVTINGAGITGVGTIAVVSGSDSKQWTVALNGAINAQTNITITVDGEGYETVTLSTVAVYKKHEVVGKTTYIDDKQFTFGNTDNSLTYTIKWPALTLNAESKYDWTPFGSGTYTVSFDNKIITLTPQYTTTDAWSGEIENKTRSDLRSELVSDATGINNGDDDFLEYAAYLGYTVVTGTGATTVENLIDAELDQLFDTQQYEYLLYADTSNYMFLQYVPKSKGTVTLNTINSGNFKGVMWDADEEDWVADTDYNEVYSFSNTTDYTRSGDGFSEAGKYYCDSQSKPKRVWLKPSSLDSKGLKDFYDQVMINTNTADYDSTEAAKYPSADYYRVAMTNAYFKTMWCVYNNYKNTSYFVWFYWGDWLEEYLDDTTPNFINMSIKSMPGAAPAAGKIGASKNFSGKSHGSALIKSETGKKRSK